MASPGPDSSTFSVVSYVNMPTRVDLIIQFASMINYWSLIILARSMERTPSLRSAIPGDSGLGLG